MKTLADALSAEIARVQAKRERWLGYQRDLGPMGPRTMFGPALILMKQAIDEGVASLASQDVARMIRAHDALKGYDDHD